MAIVATSISSEIPAYRSSDLSMWSKGWRCGESVRLPPLWPGFKSLRRCHMWGDFVVGFLLNLLREVFLRVLRFSPLLKKTNILKFQFDQELGRRTTTLWMCYLQIIIYYLFMLLTRVRVCGIASGGGHATRGLVAVMKSDNFALRFYRSHNGEPNTCRRHWTECCAKDHCQRLVQTGKKNELN